MQFPWQLHIGPIALSVHVLMETLGIAAGFRYFLFLRKRQGDRIDQPNRLWIIIAAIFGALIGSRLIGGLENPPELLASGNMPAYFYLNKTITGGLLGGVFAVEVMKKGIGEKRASGDLFVYPLLLGMMIGRIGCFSMGVHEETYGLPTRLPWGMDLGDGLPRHPVALYEILFLLVAWILLKQVRKKKPLAAGSLFKLFMIAYLLFRFALDFIKPHYTYPFGLSTIQVVCMLGILYYTPFIIQPKKLLTAYA